MQSLSYVEYQILYFASILADHGVNPTAFRISEHWHVDLDLCQASIDLLIHRGKWPYRKVKPRLPHYKEVGIDALCEIIRAEWPKEKLKKQTDAIEEIRAVRFREHGDRLPTYASLGIGKRRKWSSKIVN